VFGANQAIAKSEVETTSAPALSTDSGRAAPLLPAIASSIWTALPTPSERKNTQAMTTATNVIA
jgi:hypothetical protein